MEDLTVGGGQTEERGRAEKAGKGGEVTEGFLVKGEGETVKGRNWDSEEWISPEREVKEESSVGPEKEEGPYV